MRLRDKLLSILPLYRPLKNDLVGILIVNGGKDPQEGKWLGLCLGKIMEHTKWPNYRIYIWNSNIEDSFVRELVKRNPHVQLFQANPRKRLGHVHAVPLQKLYKIARKDNVKYVVAFDTDAFPIRDNWLTYLIQQLNKGAAIAGVWRDELKKYVDPYIHASCLCTSVDFIDRYGLRFDKIDIESDRKLDTLGYFTEIAKQKERKLSKLKRSNINQLHYIMGGIYGDLIYHHSAGSRKRGYFWGEPKTDYIGKRNIRIKQTLNRLAFQYNEQFINWLTARAQSQDNDIRNKKMIFILGMHRTGTSCLAGCLEACGLFLGDVSKSNIHNLKGNQELREVILLHDRILKKNRGSWDNPPDEIKIVTRDKIDFQRICNAFPDNVVRGIKDPRSLLLVEHWLAMERNIGFVASYRHPLSVASSLEKRNNMSIEKSLELWNIYNQKLLTLHQKYRFPIVKFDLEDPDLYLEVVAQAAIELGLNPDLERMSEFISQELEHEKRNLDAIPDSCLEIYNCLETNKFKSSRDTYSFEILNLKKDLLKMEKNSI
jgi:hypothetical protein